MDQATNLDSKKVQNVSKIFWPFPAAFQLLICFVLFPFQFLETCTIKLGLKFAARRIFLHDGTEIRTAAEIPKDGEVYISQGEPFRDPLRPMQGMYVWQNTFRKI